MQTNKTPIYDAVTELVSDVFALSSEISDTLARCADASLDERETVLRRLLCINARDNTAARYLVDELKLDDAGCKKAFASCVQELVKYDICGKKGAITNMLLKGIPSKIGDHTAVTAMDDGVVLEAGRCYDQNSREAHRGVHVTIRCESDVDVRYNRMEAVSVKVGDKVRAGQIIGKANKTNGCVIIDVRRNGRRLNTAAWCNIEVEEK